MIVKPIKTRVFKEGEDILRFITQHIRTLKEGSILVVTSKIVALSEGRTAPASRKVAVIKGESDLALKTKHVWLTLKDGDMLANAGVDESNADGKLILLPADSFSSAASLRRKIRAHYKIKKLGVILSDSRVAPLRSGVTGVALGYAGFKGLRDYRGTKDLFGRRFHYSKTNVADSLATAATLVMGEGRERQPLAVIHDAPVEFADSVKRNETRVPITEDMYAPLYQKLRTKRHRRS